MLMLTIVPILFKAYMIIFCRLMTHNNNNNSNNNNNNNNNNNIKQSSEKKVKETKAKTKIEDEVSDKRISAAESVIDWSRSRRLPGDCSTDGVHTSHLLFSQHPPPPPTVLHSGP